MFISFKLARPIQFILIFINYLNYNFENKVKLGKITVEEISITCSTGMAHFTTNYWTETEWKGTLPKVTYAVTA